MSPQLESRHRKIVEEILRKYDVPVYVFGSRAKGQARPLSDLDLCIQDDVARQIVAKMQDDFSESDLPFKVDLVLWSELSEAFREHIKRDLILFSI